MRYFETKIKEFKLRETTVDDVPLILSLIKGIAEYEKMSDLVVATEETLRESLFVREEAKVLIGEYNGEPIGYALYFFNFSTFIGRAGLYLEDIFILPEYRGKGIGKEIFKALGQIAYEKGCQRMEWVCLDWNEPSIQFYKGLGAEPQNEWIIFRLTTENIKKLAES